MKSVLILRYGEIFLKGRNQGFFEQLLINNIKTSLIGLDYSFSKIQGRYIIANYKNESEIISKLVNVFGLTSISPAIETEATPQAIQEYLQGLKFNAKSFKIDTTRADKTFPIKSLEFSQQMGDIVLKNNDIAVNVHDPEILIEIDIREKNKAFIFFKRIKGAGGMPIGCAGEGLALLSGGLDSPVASYMINKRGMHNTYLHFHSYPYTSQQAKDKVITLAKILKAYNGKSKMIFVPFTKVQEAIHKNCDGDYMITVMRRIMFKIASEICKQFNYQAIISGECLGQVASQTIESLTSSNISAGDVVVLRPLIAFDKEETVEISKKINTYETSILPYEDCCTVFLPKNPIIKPKINKVLLQEGRLDMEELITECLNNLEIIEI